MDKLLFLSILLLNYINKTRCPEWTVYVAMSPFEAQTCALVACVAKLKARLENSQKNQKINRA